MKMHEERPETGSDRLILVITDEPEEAELAAVSRLYEKAMAFDRSGYSLPDDADSYFFLYRGEKLLSFLAAYQMGETRGGRQITEIVAYTDPSERRKGYFKRLLNALSEEPEGETVLRFCVYENELLLKVLESLHARRDHAELIMTRSLSEDAVKNEAPSGLVSFEPETKQDGSEDYFCRGLFSECRVRLFGRRAYIFGVLTYEGHRRENRAFRLLGEVLSRCRLKGAAEAFLEVSDENTAAVGLYRKLGFRETERLVYYESQ